MTTTPDTGQAQEEPEVQQQVVASTGIEFSPTLANIAKALIVAQGNMDAVFKDSTNPHFRSKYADLPSCVNATKPALQAAGIALIQAATSSPDASVIFVETMFLHESGEWVRSRLGLRPVKSDPQGAGSALTYGRRYTLLAMCGVAPEDDDDGNAASRSPRTPRAESQTTPKRSDAPQGTQRAANGTPDREKLLSVVGRGFVALGLFTDAEIEQRIKAATGRTLPADAWFELETDELVQLSRALVTEYNTKPAPPTEDLPL